jgi:hypothetical protein
MQIVVYSMYSHVVDGHHVARPEVFQSLASLDKFYRISRYAVCHSSGARMQHANIKQR